MNTSILTSLVFGCLVMTSLVMATPLKFKEEECDKETNCKAPDCRCWDDASNPGDIEPHLTPQMLILSFDYTINNHTIARYEDLLKDIENPNGCPVKATFFVKKHESDPATINRLAKDGHELGINSDRGILPQDEKAWETLVDDVEEFMTKKANISSAKIKGMRAPDLAYGGDGMFKALNKFGLKYDSSCVDIEHSNMWPYTLDFTKNIPRCSAGKKTTGRYAGVWEFPVSPIRFDGRVCPIPSACNEEVKNVDDVIQMFTNVVVSHFSTNRAPVVLDLDPSWFAEDYKFVGTKQFLETTIYGLGNGDIYIVSMEQALAWLKKPTNVFEIPQFGPWACY